MKRRDVLKTTAALGASGFALHGFSTATASDGTPDETLSPSAWPQFGRSGRNNPRTDVELTSYPEHPRFGHKWSADPGDANGFPGQAVAADGVVYTVNAVGTVTARNLDDGTKLWSTDKLGRCYSTPAVVDGTVYVLTTTQTVALDAASGSTKWSVDRGGYASPTVDGDTVYIAGQSSGWGGQDEVYEPKELAALSTADGSTNWVVSSDAMVDTTPAVAYGRVYIGTEAGIWAVTASDGETVWTTDFGDGHSTTVTIEDQGVYGQSAGTVFALDVESGTKLWTRSLGPTPAPRAGSSANSPRWFADAVYTAAVIDDIVFVTVDDADEEYDSRTLYGLESDTGDTIWTHSGARLVDDRGDVLTAPVVTNDTVYFFSRASADDPENELTEDVDPVLLQGVEPSNGFVHDTYTMLDYVDSAGDYNAFAPVSVVDGTLLATSYIENGTEGKLDVYEAISDSETEATYPKEVTLEPEGAPNECEETVLTVDFPQNEEGYDRYTTLLWYIDDEYRGTTKGQYHGTDVSVDLDAGRHTAQVRAYDRWGRTDAAETEFVVSKDCESPTSVDIAVETENPTVGEPVTFEADVTGDASTLEYEWKIACGDDVDHTGKTIQHTFEKPLEWGVRLITTDTETDEEFVDYTTVMVEDAE
ncbi:PQQ-binding-like beta-propeller repeat protein [Haloarchaeobius sp. DFWS5]|uniref:outer membrane protein assembly factor BamB family protein n=1 Tax=Haloarchaeobius sp. DFWS5 TaxID=3446114 RepID=UPI003EBB5D79